MDLAEPDIAEALNARAAAGGWQIHCDSKLDCEHPALNELRDLWRQKCDARLPARTDFSARDLKVHLPFLTIYDILRAPSGTRYRHRYVGMAVVDRMGEMTGRTIDEILPADQLARTQTYYDCVAATARALRVVSDMRFTPVNYLRCETLLLPLAADGATPDMILGGWHFRIRDTLGV